MMRAPPTDSSPRMHASYAPTPLRLTGVAKADIYDPKVNLAYGELAAHYGWLADGVLVGNGSNELIQSTLAVTLSAGDAVVAPSPTFSLYRLLTAVLGGRYVPVPLGDDYVFDVDALIDTARRTWGASSAPSSSLGMNSVPSSGTEPSAASTTTPAMPSVRAG